jgi:hypothetical protein
MIYYLEPQLIDAPTNISFPHKSHLSNLFVLFALDCVTDVRTATLAAILLKCIMKHVSTNLFLAHVSLLEIIRWRTTTLSTSFTWIQAFGY